MTVPIFVRKLRARFRHWFTKKGLEQRLGRVTARKIMLYRDEIEDALIRAERDDLGKRSEMLAFQLEAVDEIISYGRPDKIKR